MFYGDTGLKAAGSLFLLFVIGSLPVSAQESASSLRAALVDGKTALNIRYRYEQVDQSDLLETADASTVRTRLGYTTGEIGGFSAMLEMEDIHKVVKDDYTTPSTGPLATESGPKQVGFPVVADPVDTELNQSYLQYRYGGSMLRFGRQKIVRGNARFIGDVGWRQNQQTFDGFAFENTSIDKLSVFAAYISNRRSVTFTDIDMDTALFDISYAGVPGGKLSAYYYDIQSDVANGPFWETAGLRYDGQFGAFGLTLEYATQEQANAAEPEYSVVELSFKNTIVTPTIGVETLGSDNSSGFATPLATLHAFNGWADMFLTTPAVGLQDAYLTLSANAGGFKLLLAAHDYSADVGDVDYGEEIDFSVVKPITGELSIGIKFASYTAGDALTLLPDVDKIWFWTELAF